MNAVPLQMPDWLGILGEALLHSLWQGLAVALVLAAALRALRAASPEAPYALSLAALAVLAIWPAAGLMGALSDETTPRRAGAVETRERWERTQAIGAGPPIHVVGRPMEGARAVTLAVGQDADPWSDSSFARALPWLGAVWLLGVVALSLRLIGGWLHAWRLVRLAAPASGAWAGGLARAATRLRVRRAVRLLESACVTSPVVLGWLRPVILVPASAISGLTPAEIEAIMAHELAHVRRGDYLVNLLQTAVETLLFYHPAAWWIGRRIRFERELCCDDWAVRVCDDQRAYAQALVRLEELRMEQPVSGFALAASAGPLRRRIERLLIRPAGEREVGLAAGAASLATAIAIGVALGVATGAVGPAVAQGAGDGRVLKFPEDRVVGKLFVRPALSEADETTSVFDGWRPHGEARGDVQIGDGLEVKLSVNRGASADLLWLAKVAPDGIALLDLDDTAVDDAGLAQVATLKGLREIRLESTRISDAGIRHLRDLKNLRYVQADAFGVSKEGFGVGDEGLAVLATLPKLEHLGLRLTQVTDVGMVQVGKMKKLRHLSISGTRVTDAGLAQLRGLKALASISLGEHRSGRFTDVGMEYVAQVTGLSRLVLSGCPITDAGLAKLAPLVRLSDLTIDGTKVTEQGLAHLAPFQQLVRLRVPSVVGDVGAEHLSKLPNLEEIESNMNGLTDRGVEHLSRLSKLKELSLSDSPITDRALDFISRMPSLEKLWLQNCPVTDEGLRLLERLPRLSALLLSQTHMSSRGLHAVARLKALERLSLHYPCTNEPAKLDLSPLREMATLKVLKLDLPNITDDDLAPVAALSKLESFEMGGEPDGSRLGDHGLTQLAGLTELTELLLDNTDVSDEGLKALSGLQKLQTFTLSAPITDAGLNQLVGLRALVHVQIASPAVTEQGLARLAAALPAVQMVNHFSFQAGGHETIVSPRDGLQRTGRSEDRQKRDPLEGQPAPELQVTGWINTAGQPLSLTGLRGKVVLIDHWGVWCGPCVKALPQLESIHQKHHDRGLVVIGLHSTYRGEQAFDFIDKARFSFPVAIDVRDQTSSAYFVQFVPDFCLIDKQGRLRMAGLHPADLEKAIELLLAE